MEYFEFKGEKLSRLGMGNMRLPTQGGDRRGPIDEGPAIEIIEAAHAADINYYDTAYRYHGGESETLVGRVLAQYPRESWKLATKMPGHQLHYRDGKLEFTGYFGDQTSATSPTAIFEHQLARCGVDFFDYYLLHNLSDSSLEFYTDADLAVVEMLLEQQSRGRIRHLGFSSHATLSTLRGFLDRFPDTFSFVQMQLNYLDWTLQEAGKQYELLTERGIPVWVMEPVRGGRLANLPADAEALLKGARPADSVASWAFRYVRALPNVGVILSGMSTMGQLQDNVKTFSDPTPITAAERGLLDKVVDSLVNSVPCTACRYCCEECPQELDIPRLIALYNELTFEASPSVRMAIAALGEEDLPSNCLACGACSRVCPQGIDVPAVLKALDERIANLPPMGPPFGPAPKPTA